MAHKRFVCANGWSAAVAAVSSDPTVDPTTDTASASGGVTVQRTVRTLTVETGLSPEELTDNQNAATDADIPLWEWPDDCFVTLSTAGTLSHDTRMVILWDTSAILDSWDIISVEVAFSVSFSWWFAGVKHNGYWWYAPDDPTAYVGPAPIINIANVRAAGLGVTGYTPDDFGNPNWYPGVGVSPTGLASLAMPEVDGSGDWPRISFFVPTDWLTGTTDGIYVSMSDVPEEATYDAEYFIIGGGEDPGIDALSGPPTLTITYRVHSDSGYPPFVPGTPSSGAPGVGNAGRTPPNLALQNLGSRNSPDIRYGGKLRVGGGSRIVSE